MLAISRRSGEVTVLTLPTGEVVRIIAGRNREGETLFHIDAPMEIHIGREDAPPRRKPQRSPERPHREFRIGRRATGAA